MRIRSAIVVIVIALATTVVGAGAAFGQTFTDDPLTAATTTVKAVHVTELRTAIANLRALLELPVFSWTADPLGNTLVRAIQIAELRTALDQVYDAFPKLRPTYTDPILTELAIKAVHLEQLRTAVLNVSNDAPAFTKGADQTVNEDAAAQTIVGWATAISPGPRETTQTVTFVFDTNDNPSLFSAGPSVASNGTLTYTPAANQNGVAHLTLHAHDDGGTSHGGVDNSPTQSFMITVNPVNDVPSFTKGADETVLEDTGLHTVVGWATAISPGPNEAVQTLTFNITGNTNSALFSVPPAVASNGTLTYTLAANVFGSSTITLTLSDNGGTANGGVDTSAPQTFAINVTGINDVPSFTKGADQTVNEDAGPQSVVGWATSISPGPAETGQTVTFVIDTNDNTGLFSAGPAVAADGTLTYTPAANQNGVANITLHIQDNGGTANGGVDASATQSFVITVNAVNDAPTVTNKTFEPNAVQTNMKIIGLTGLLNGVADVDAGVNGCSPTFTVTGVSGGTSPAGGAVTVTNASTGTFDFDPPPGVTGNVTFTYTVQDTGCPGTATSAAATVTVDVAGPVIWFVNPAVPGPGDGRLSNPFKFLTGNAGVNNDADDVDAASHAIFVYTGTVTGGMVLNTSEALIGQGALNAPNTFDALMGITPPAGTITRPSIGGTRPTVANTSGTAITLGSNNVVKGLNVTNSSGSGITGSGVDTLTLADFDVTVTGGSALSVTTSGTVTATGTNNDLNSTNGTALNVNAVTIGGAGLIFKSISAGAGANNGISLVNTGAGGLTVTGSDGGDAGTDPDLGSGGTITGKTGADGSQTAGIGVNLANANSISLNGMIISNHQNQAIRGNEVEGFRMTFCVVGGLNGTTPSGTFNESSVSFLGTPTTGYGLRGTVSILDNEITGGAQRNVSIDNATGTMNINFLRNNVHHTQPDTGDDGVGIEVDTNATMFANVSNNVFTAHGGDHFNLSLLNNAIAHLTYKNNDMQGGHNVGLGQGVFVLGATFNGTLRYDISNNGTVADPMVGNKQGAAIFVNKGSGTGTFSGQIKDNVIGNPAVPLSGSEQAQGIHSSARGVGGSHTTLVTGNLVRQFNDRGIVLEAGEGAPTFIATVTNNTVSDPGSAINSLHGIHFDFGILTADNAQVTIDARNNLIANGGNEPQGGVDFRMRTAGSNDVFVAGYSGGNVAASVQSFIDAQNPDGTSFSVSLVTSQGPPPATYNNGPASPLPAPILPTLPPAPLLLAAGGIEATTGMPVDVSDGTLKRVGGTPALPATIVRALTQTELDSLVATALARWPTTGVTGEQLTTLRRLKFAVADLPGWYLGEAGGDRIRVDNNAGGNGWFIGARAEDDALFAKEISATRRYTDPASAPAGRVDLLTAVMHEMGHALGLPDSYAEEDRDSLMSGYLTAGERRIPDRSLTRTRSR